MGPNLLASISSRMFQKTAILWTPMFQGSISLLELLSYKKGQNPHIQHDFG